MKNQFGSNKGRKLKRMVCVFLIKVTQKENDGAFQTLFLNLVSSLFWKL